MACAFLGAPCYKPFMRCETIHILWDGSHIWGLMAWRGIRALGLPCRLVKAQEIARNAFHGKAPALLLAPGGNARKKARALGPAGLANIREYLAGGGSYLGFCGGAGLALTPDNGEAALALCPWPRAPYKSRIFHLISGHLRARINPGKDFPGMASLPVWWPGRFAPIPGREVAVLAECCGPDEDFWLADIPLARVPKEVLARWRKCHGLNMDYLERQPLVVGGNFGRGKYVLSYSHLETPNSRCANAWLADILEEFCGLAPAGRLVPEWNPGTDASTARNCPRGLNELGPWGLAGINRLLQLGEDLRLFFHRASWLRGWRSGLPGMACNNLRVAFGELAQMPITDEMEKFWQQAARFFLQKAEKFFDDAEGCLWDMRLERTLASEGKFGPLAPQLARIFGHPMLGGGIAEELLTTVEELIYLGLGKDNINF